MNQNLKTAIKREYVKCVESPQHFMRKYCTIQHPKRGKMKFDLYDYQDDMVNQFKSHRYNIILKSRQLGISTLSAGYSLWMMLFNADKNILVIAKDKDTAKNLVTKVRVMYHIFKVFKWFTDKSCGCYTRSWSFRSIITFCIR